jgi:hypothetical protein
MAKPRPKPKPKLTDAERHKSFLEMARKVEASKKAEDFDRAFKRVAQRSRQGDSN